MLEKLKLFILNDQAFYSCLVILVAIISFYLGQLSMEPTPPHTERVRLISEANEPKTTLLEGMDDSKSQTNSNSATVIGSRTGTKYHLPECPGAKQIKKENLISWNSISEAEAAGYKPAANCLQLP